MTDDKHRRQWMAMLGKMVAPMDAERAIKALCDMLPLMTSLDEDYFTAQSLAFVAGRCKRVPTFGELKVHFGAWWQENLPADKRMSADAYPALPGPVAGGRQAPTEIEKHLVSETVRAFHASTTMARSHLTTPEAERPPAAYLADQQLLAQYEATANSASLPRAAREIAQTRVDMLRRKMGMDMIEHAEAAA